MAALGVPFDLVASSETFGATKPDPLFFERLVAATGDPAASIAYVGDRLDNDVVAARAAGMQGILLRRGPWATIATGTATRRSRRARRRLHPRPARRPRARRGPRPRRGSMADAGRVIAGTRGRPAADRATGGGDPAARRPGEADAVRHPRAGPRRGARLDLFAGSGAAGIEALSRGAASAVFVERDGRAARTIAENLRATGARGPGGGRHSAEVAAWLAPRRDGADRFDVVIVDPPYAETELLATVLGLLGHADAPLAPAARVVAKHFWRDRPPERIGLLASERERRFGETALTFYRRIAEEVG